MPLQRSIRSWATLSPGWKTHSSRDMVRPFSLRFASSIAGHIHTNPVLELQQRGLVAAMTSPDLVDHVNAGPTAIYCGVDPTASSLHLGNLVTLLGLLHFHIKGHTTIGLVGGATGSIGDPSGKSTERQPMSASTLAHNVAGIDAQFQRFFVRGRDYAERRGYAVEGSKGGQVKVVNNKTWFGKISALEFLGDIGRFARVGTMIARDSVKSRLESPQGISFTEFSYQLLQAYDFWHLFHEDGCRIQLGGSDQWGNITAGIDLIHKKRKTTEEQVVIDNAGNEKALNAYGLTIPLLTTATGEKFGKSAGNAVWLDEKMTSLFDFYQFFVKTADADVGRYLHYFTLLTSDEIKDIMEKHNSEPEKRLAQHALAKETTELVHGVDAVSKALLATHVLFGSSLETVKGKDLIEAFEHDARMVTLGDRPQVSEMSLDRIAFQTGLCASKSEAKKLLKSGGFYINNVKITDPMYRIADKDWIDGAVCVLRSGKSNYKLVQVA